MDKHIIKAIESRRKSIGPHDYGDFHHLALIWGAGPCLKEDGLGFQQIYTK